MFFDIYNPYPNQTVTAFYVKVIVSALEKSGNQTNVISKLCKGTQNFQKGVVVVAARDATKARKMGYRAVLLWVQGISPEESFMRNHSRIRRAVLSHREKKGLKNADFVFLCSHAMKAHYQKKYGLSLNDSFIMPCFNDELNESAFATLGKYEQNIFLYAGAMDVWQCFEETVQLYKAVEDRVENAFFRVLVRDHETATTILRKYGVRHYSLGFVPADKIGEEMAAAKFGFCIRADHAVNRVATPTKLSTYVSYGVIPIYSDCIEDFHVISGGNPYVCAVSPAGTPSESDVDGIVSFCTRPIRVEEILGAYRNTYGDYYSKEYYASQLMIQLKGYIEKWETH